jgi:nucleoside-diphosphate-sugar epimerase
MIIEGKDQVELFLFGIKVIAYLKYIRQDIMSIYPRGVLNVETGIATSVSVLANQMIEISGLTVKPIHKRGINQRSEVRNSYADTTKATRLLKFRAQKALEDGLKDVLKEGYIQR